MYINMYNHVHLRDLNILVKLTEEIYRSLSTPWILCAVTSWYSVCNLNSFWVIPLKAEQIWLQI